MKNFAEIKEHVDLNFDAAMQAEKLSKADKKPRLKKIWVIAEPILKILSTFPLLPNKWKNALKALITVIDLIADGEIDDTDEIAKKDAEIYALYAKPQPFIHGITPHSSADDLLDTHGQLKSV
jgi:hypothetical protein